MGRPHRDRDPAGPGLSANSRALHKSDLRVEPWSKARVAELQHAGRPVLVDFTAEWCAICQVNKRVALEQREVIARLKELDVTVLMADWTDQNAEVAAGLAEFGRAAGAPHPPVWSATPPSRRRSCRRPSRRASCWKRSTGCIERILDYRVSLQAAGASCPRIGREESGASHRRNTMMRKFCRRAGTGRRAVHGRTR